MKVKYEVILISIANNEKQLAALGKKILSGLKGFNHVTMEIEEM